MLSNVGKTFYGTPPLHKSMVHKLVLHYYCRMVTRNKKVNMKNVVKYWKPFFGIPQLYKHTVPSNLKNNNNLVEIEINIVRTRPDNTDSLRKSANKLKNRTFTSTVFQFSPTRIFQQKSPFRESVTYVFSGCHYVFTIFFSTPEKHIKLFLDKEIPRCRINSQSHMLLEFSKNSVRNFSQFFNNSTAVCSFNKFWWLQKKFLWFSTFPIRNLVTGADGNIIE